MKVSDLRYVIIGSFLLLSAGCGLINQVVAYKFTCDGRAITAVIPTISGSYLIIDERRVPANYSVQRTDDGSSPQYFDFFDGIRQARLTIIYDLPTPSESTAASEAGFIMLIASATLDYVNTDQAQLSCSAPIRAVT